ncbi:phosphatase PAP2 family protein [Planctomicrobium sp. SH664]|uniref:phosphatase PAP2 family protein n=1 Tax=Planctomicrobium sp. SH664 TaxID=3448125 RepID=UPI003F5B19A8
MASAVWRKGVKWLGGREPAVLLSLLVIFTASWIFIHVADEVADGETHQFEYWLLRVFRTAEDPAVPIGPAWLQEMVRDLTALGGFSWLCFFTFAVAGFFWLDRKRHLAMFLLVSVTSGYLVSTLLKMFFQRPRPDIVPHLSYAQNSTSFPSGHSMNSAIVYLTLGTIVATSVATRKLKMYVICVALVLMIAVGVSRVYLGVHYPTDVLAGWMAGTVWALLCWLVARLLQRRGQIEPPTPDVEEEKPFADSIAP